jgi:hypothetical protein
MYAQVEQISGQSGPGTSGPDRADLGAAAEGQDGIAGRISLRQLGGSATVRLTLWGTEEDAARGQAAASAGQIFEVRNTGYGTAAAQPPTHAVLLYFDGPKAPEQLAAAEFGGRQRIWPAIRDLSGLVGQYALVGEDLGAIVVTLATSADALDAVGRAALATELLPGEDLALLPGPDRVEIYAVEGYQMSGAGPASTMSGR